MEFDEVVRARRSVRAFLDRDVPAEIVREILDLARHAPSSLNGQPWQFVVVRDPAMKRRLAKWKNDLCPVEKREFRADFLVEAPVVLVIAVDHARSYEREVENAVLAASHVMLAARARGLGSVYMSAYRPSDPRVAATFRRLLDIPDTVDPVSMIPIGYPAEQPASRDLRPLDEAIHHETHGA